MWSVDTYKSHLEKQLDFIQKEKDAETDVLMKEIKKAEPYIAERKGYIIQKLKVELFTISMGGRNIIKLVKSNYTILPLSKISVGSSVAIYLKDSDKAACMGSVRKYGKEFIELVSDDDICEKELNGILRLELRSDNISYKRYENAIKFLNSNCGNKDHALLEHVLRHNTTALSNEHFDKIPYDANPDLNESQNSSIKRILDGSPLQLIHGPPGTGKTSTLSWLIKSLINNGLKVLACAGTNTAVDNLIDKLMGIDVPVVRIGHPARIDERLYDVTLEKKLETLDSFKKVREFEKELSALFKKRDKRKSKGRYLDKDEYRSENGLITAYKKEISRLQKNGLGELIDLGHVVCSTNTGSAREELKHKDFDIVIVDEAGQVTEPSALIPLLKGRRFVLAGDHKQLPPTIISDEAIKNGFGISLFERLMVALEEDYSQLLNIQYRMHANIVGFSSRYFYRGELKGDSKNLEHTLENEPSEFSNPFEFIDTAGADYEEEFDPKNKSYINPKEADLVNKIVQQYLSVGLLSDKIGVIAPYRAQVQHIKTVCLTDGIEIKTVDSFQGREKDFIIISLTRSNATGQIGFLRELRRMNVAMTRARKKLIIIGDASTLSQNSFYSELIDYAQEIDAYKSIWELTDYM